MELRKERLKNCYQEVAALIDDYYARTNAQDGIPKLEMHWPFFLKLDKAERLWLCTARDEGKLVGVGMYILGVHPQHKTRHYAMCNTLGVNPDYRGKGIGTSLVEYAEAQLREKGISMMIHGHRVIYKTEPLFTKLGFVETERMFMKVL